MLRANSEIGPYTLIKQLGKGAFGVVWLAEKRTAIATSQVAIKIALDEEPDIQSVKQEASLWSQIGGHPNVLPMIEANIYDGQVVIVSEYAPDGSLESWLKMNGGKAPTVEQAVNITLGILSGLEHLHSKKVLHRDLKPANILLQGDTPRLADFGLSRILKTTQQSTNASGTPAYMSPEAFDGKKVIQSDIWAAGVIFYQLLTGNSPFPAKDYAGLIGAIFTKDPEAFPENLKQFTPIITKALQKDPDGRYLSTSLMKSDLQKVLKPTSELIVKKKIILAPNVEIGPYTLVKPSTTNIGSALFRGLLISCVIVLGVIIHFAFFRTPTPVVISSSTPTETQIVKNTPTVVQTPDEPVISPTLSTSPTPKASVSPTTNPTPKATASPTPKATDKASTDTSLPNSLAGAGKYTLQVRVTQSQNEAESIGKKLRSTGAEVYVVKADLGAKGIWYRVRVGRYQSFAEAQKAGAELKNKGSVAEFIATTY
jgi:serine/threonine protein kinase